MTPAITRLIADAIRYMEWRNDRVCRICGWSCTLERINGCDEDDCPARFMRKPEASPSPAL